MFLHGVWIEDECDMLEELPSPPSNSLSALFSSMEMNEDTKAYTMFILNAHYDVHTVEDLKKLSTPEWTDMRVSSIVKAKIKASPLCKYSYFFSFN
jgi:hypothetical protein